MNEKLADNLKSEYLALQSHYEGFDTRIISIKTWGTALFAGAIVVGVKEDSPLILILTTFASGVIWWLEARWKTFQYCYTDRIKEIEAWFRNPEATDIAPFQIFTAWGVVWNRHFKTRKALLTVALQPFVLIPYLPTLAISMIAAIFTALN